MKCPEVILIMSKGRSLMAFSLSAILGLVSGCQFPDGTGERTIGNRGGTPPVQDSRVAGIWDGITVGAASVRMTALVNGGRFMMIGEGLVYDGTYPATNNSNIEVTADIYVLNGPKDTIASPVRITGGIDRPVIELPQPQGVNLLMEEAVWDRGSSLDKVNTSWTFRPEPDAPAHLTLSIGPTGRFNDQDADGCIYQAANPGQGLTIIDTAINLYQVRFRVGGECGAFLGNEYTGFATLFPNDNTLFMVTTNGSNAIFYVFQRN